MNGVYLNLDQIINECCKKKKIYILYFYTSSETSLKVEGVVKALYVSESGGGSSLEQLTLYK